MRRKISRFSVTAAATSGGIVGGVLSQRSLAVGADIVAAPLHQR